MPTEQNSRRNFLRSFAVGDTSVLIAPEILVVNGLNR
jgi:hypothetical protein